MDQHQVRGDPACYPIDRQQFDLIAYHPLHRLLRRHHHLWQMAWPDLPPLHTACIVVAEERTHLRAQVMEPRSTIARRMPGGELGQDFGKWRVCLVQFLEAYEHS
jgi:hypothetical protein